jgi:protein-S-isoprenylcysteine O-methyltransferase Ste14
VISRILKLLYGAASYTVFLAAFLYAVGFVAGLAVPKAIDHGAATPLPAALAIDAALLGLFAVQHSLMARPAFKRWWTRIVSPDIERSTYVLLSSLTLGLIFWQWRAAPGLVWNVGAAAAAAIWALCAAGWLIVLASTFMLSHFELFGLTQVFAALRRRPPPEAQFRTPLLYGLVRHPIMLGFVIAFWAAPRMSVGHLFFAAATTSYILLALQLEEHDLVASFGATYIAYRQRVPMLLPFVRLGSTAPGAARRIAPE